jgi:hypothetical protein
MFHNSLWQSCLNNPYAKGMPTAQAMIFYVEVSLNLSVITGWLEPATCKIPLKKPDSRQAGMTF